MTEKSRSNCTRNVRWVSLMLLCFIMGFLLVPLSFWRTVELRLCTTCLQSHWSLSNLDKVVMHFHRRSKTYGERSDAWDYMLPSGEHLVRQGHSDGTVSVHTVAVFHQLYCLNVIRRTHTKLDPVPPSALYNHCLDYLRESVLCQMDMSEEQIPDKPLINGVDRMCLNWEVVWEEAEKNYRQYLQYLQA